MSVYINASQTTLSRLNITDLRNPTSKNSTVTFNHLIGIAQPYIGNIEEIPDNYILLAGQEISRTAYPIAFARLGTLWGGGDGETTFNLPDGRNKSFYAMGQDANLDYQESDINTGDTLQCSIINVTATRTAAYNRLGGNSYSGVWYQNSNAVNNTSAVGTGGYNQDNWGMNLSLQVPTGDTDKPNSFVGNWIMAIA